MTGHSLIKDPTGQQVNIILVPQVTKRRPLIRHDTAELFYFHEERRKPTNILGSYLDKRRIYSAQYHHLQKKLPSH